MDLKEIRQILKLMDTHGLTEFTLERDDEKLALKREVHDHSQSPVIQHVLAPVATPPPGPALQAAPAVPPAEAEEAKEDESLHLLTSPMVGTFYAASSPDSDPYARVGAPVSPDTTVCIIEAMKIMNEIKAEVSGVIEKVCVQNGQPVEFGETLFKVRLA